jgi:hypothetical protein
VQGFLIERYWPGVTLQEVGRLNARLKDAGNADVSFIGSLLVPADELVLFEFRASSEQAVLDLSERARLRCDRIVSVTRVPPTPPGG